MNRSPDWSVRVLVGALGALGVSCVALVFGGCGQEFIPSKLSVIQEKVLTPSCTFSSCHDQSRPEAKMNLTEGHAWASLVDVPAEKTDGIRVIPGDAEHSVLYQMILGIRPGLPRMPKGGGLEENEIDAIRRWIDRGAPDN